MQACKISKFSGEFESPAREQAFLAAGWSQTAMQLRIAAAGGFLAALSLIYVYYLSFGSGPEFQTLFLLQICNAAVLAGLFFTTRSDSYTLIARWLGPLSLLLFSISELIEYYFLLHGSSHGEPGTPFTIVIILIAYTFIPNRARITIFTTFFISFVFLLYYFTSPLISFQAAFTILFELLILNAIGCLIMVNENRLRRQAFAQRQALEDEVSKRKKAETALQKASAAKTRFLASASHDLRQPLQAQRLYVETMVAQAKDTSVRKLAQKIIASHNSMQKMLDALLDLSRLDAGMVRPRFADVSLKHLFMRLEQEFSSLARRKGLLFYLHWPPDSATVRSDPGMLESILSNLIGNAVRYTEQGAVMLAARRRGVQWQLEVRDSGAGIAEEHQQDIFEEFHQLGNPERDREKGLGLGLSIVRRLARLLEHELSLFSRPGRGSVFAVRLPVGLFPVAEALQAPAGVFAGLSDRRILVVDDEYSIRDGIACALESYGCTVIQAAGYQQARAAVEQQLPDALLVDYRLAAGENGIELINDLHDCAGVTIPALLLTGDTEPKALHSIEQSGIPALHKPVALNELTRALLKLLEKPATT